MLALRSRSMLSVPGRLEHRNAMLDSAEQRIADAGPITPKRAREGESCSARPAEFTENRFAGRSPAADSIIVPNCKGRIGTGGGSIRADPALEMGKDGWAGVRGSQTRAKWNYRKL